MLRVFGKFFNISALGKIFQHFKMMRDLFLKSVKITSLGQANKSGPNSHCLEQWLGSTESRTGQ